jgi:4'-phosphopantetheinyl transferase
MSSSVDGGPVPITRWYLDTRPLQPENMRAEVALPLISTVSAGDQANITRFMQAKDKLMSLASTLLKYLFIHRTAQIPWSQVTISRWPAPHKRPYWSPPSSWPGTYGLEFNVSHQAGLTALVGCKTPDKDSSSQPDLHFNALHSGTLPYSSNSVAKPRLGVDITCTSESHRGPKQMTTSAEFAQWVDIFTDMFSARERYDMQHAPTTTTTDTEIEPPTEKAATLAKLRRFYTYWSLKEAYIKMVGEGLLASWLRELEFSSVVPPPLPAPTPTSDRQPPEDSWGPTIHTATEANPAGFQISVRRQSVKDVSMSLTAYGPTFIIATATKGMSASPSDSVPEWRQIDIEQDIRLCAEGRCDCPLLP